MYNIPNSLLPLLALSAFSNAIPRPSPSDPLPLDARNADPGTGIPSDVLDADAAQAQSLACAQISTPPNPSCWDQLGMDSWMTNWNKTTTRCSQSTEAPGCQCGFNEPWGDCFMRMALLANESSCATIASGGAAGCEQPIVGHTVQGPPQIFYGAYSIWGMFAA